MRKMTIEQLRQSLKETPSSLASKVNLNYIVYSSKNLAGCIISASSKKGKIIKHFQNVDLSKYFIDEKDAESMLDLTVYDVNHLEKGESEELYKKVQKLPVQDQALVIDIMR